MSDAKLGKILELLESRNRILRSEAISTLIQYAPISLQQTMYSWDQLFNIVTKCFRSSLWECRVASAELLSALLEITNKSFHEHFELLFSRSSGKMKDNFDACATLLNNVDLCQIELDYNVLLGFEENNDLAPSNRNKVLQNTNSNSSNRKKQQRQLIDQHLDMNSATGVSSSTFITDDEIVCSSENNGLICTTGSELEACRKELYEEMSILDNKSDFFKSEKPAKRAKDDLANAVNDYDKMADIESDDQKMRLPMIFLKSLCEFFQFTLLRDLVNPRWQTRHGAALVLAQICNHAGNLLFYCPDLLTVIITRLLHLLCMDRFCDFVTGSNVVAPVREATAQAFSFVLLKLSDNFICKSINHEEDIGLSIPVRDAMLNQICNLLLMKTEQNWHCRQSALLVAKYHFTLTTFSLPSEHKLFDLTLCALECDPVDEVISASSQALCSFFLAAKSGTTKFNSEFLAKIGQKTPLRLWKILQHPKRLSQLREGVDSVLVDLLGLLEFCLCTNWQDGRNTSQPSTQININQLTTMIELLECSPQLCPTERNIKVLQCLCAIFENDSLTSFSNCVNEQIWTDKLIFQTLKRLYRCVLFCPPSSAEKLLSGCQTTMRFLLNFFQRHIDLNSTLDILLGSDLSLSIGRWISCLMYDHRNPEIDVFLHNVDGWDSRRDIKELLCGVELHFMDKKQIDITIIERKAMAAEFLAPLIYALYRWGRPLGQQSMFVSLQLLFFPYLRSNSLYQKLGSALLVERWATVHHRNMQTDRSLIMPDLLIKELYEQLFNDANSGKLFDETTQLVNVLTRECNEFKQYCLRKGVHVSELLPLNQVTSMEEAVNSAYRACEDRLEQEDDLRALTARHSLIIELIEDTKLATRTYTSRINSLISSALLNFVDQASLPVQLTPLIKPLMDAIEFETCMYIVCSQFVNAFFTLIELTSNRKPCPHAKILRQLFLGLGTCDQWAPKMSNWGDLSVRHLIISWENSFLNSEDLPRGTKSRNCLKILKLICEKCGDKIVKIFPEMINGNICLLNMLREDNKPEEEFLLRLDFYGVVFPVITDRQLRLSIVREKISSNIPCIILLLSNSNPAVRFRVARFLAKLTEIELCPMLSLIFLPLSQMISDSPSESTEWARFGASEFLFLISNIGSKLLGAVSLLSPLALRCIGDRNESIRAASAYAFRHFVTLLPLENKQKHFLHELFENSETDKQSTMMMQTTYLNSFSLVDVLGCPGNLPKLKREDIPFLVDTLNLRTYQLEGITWLSFLGRFGLNGILADDMGLGKTLQVLSLLSWDHAQRCNENGRAQLTNKSSYVVSSLIICPRTLVDHWCKEWKSYFSSSQIYIEKLTDCKERHSVISNGNRERILVISYEELRSNKVLCEQNWHYVILDEGHCIRNPSSQLFENICALKSAHRLILSGTPVQNSPADLWALFTFLMPGYLSSRAAFHSKFMRPIMACRSQRSSEQQIKDGEQALQSLHKQCLPFILRRLKAEVLTELPEKIVQDRECELSLLQRHLYKLIVEFCSLNVRGAGGGEKYGLTPIQVLHALRKLVDHPFLIAKLVESLKCEDASFNQLMEQCKKLNVEHSGKMLALRELLAECGIGGFSNGESDDSYSVDKSGEDKPVQIQVDKLQTNYAMDNNESNLVSSTYQEMTICRFDNSTTHKALIFCQWRATIDLVSHFLKSGAFGAGINFLVLDGQTPLNQRQSIVDRFNTDPNLQLLLLTTHVGGIGLNLTGADVVIFVDHDWNPFRDLQAIDRAHRLGQNRTVNVFRLITLGTVEEKVMKLQQFKEDTANALIGVENRSMASMATDELLELFSLKCPESNLEVNSKVKKVKKSRMSADASCSSETGVWAVNELWGDQKEEAEFEQYIEQHSVQKFLHSIIR